MLMLISYLLHALSHCGPAKKARFVKQEINSKFIGCTCQLHRLAKKLPIAIISIVKITDNTHLTNLCSFPS